MCVSCKTLKCNQHAHAAYGQVTLPDVGTFARLRFSAVFPPNAPFIHFQSSVPAASHYLLCVLAECRPLKISDLQQPWLSPCYDHAYLTWLQEETEATELRLECSIFFV